MSNATLTQKFLISSSFEEFQAPADQSQGVAKFEIELPDEIDFNVDEDAHTAVAILDVKSNFVAFLDVDMKVKAFEVNQINRFILDISEFFSSEKDASFGKDVANIFRADYMSNFINITCRDNVKQLMNSTRFHRIDIPYNVEWTV